jgi:hypothetical protein
MSLSQKVLALVSGIDNPRVRIDIMSTINFLFDLYTSGRVNEEQLRTDLFDICQTIVSECNPDLLEDEVRKRASLLVDELARTMKVEGLRARTLSRFAGRPVI